MNIAGAVIVFLVCGFCWFVDPPEDEYGRYKPEAYLTAICLLCGLIIGFLMTLL